MDGQASVRRAGILRVDSFFLNLLAILFFLFVGYVVWVFARTYWLEDRYAAVSQGSSERDVIAVIGKPREIQTCEITSWDAEPTKEHPIHGCITQYDYFAPFPVPEEFAIGFDASHRAITKYEYVSP